MMPQPLRAQCFKEAACCSKPETLNPRKQCVRIKWVAVKIMVPFGIPIIIRHLIFRVP